MSHAFEHMCCTITPSIVFFQVVLHLVLLCITAEDERKPLLDDDQRTQGDDQPEPGMLLDCQPESTAKSNIISMCLCSSISAHTEH